MVADGADMITAGVDEDTDGAADLAGWAGPITCSST